MWQNFRKINWDYSNLEKKDNCSYTNSRSRHEAELGKQDFIMLKYAFSYNCGIKSFNGFNDYLSPTCTESN